MIATLLLAPLAVLLAPFALFGAAYHGLAVTRALRRYPPPGRLVDVGGYRLHVNCVGKGGPAVVFDSGNGGCSLDWVLVQPEVGRFARACTIDRAGHAWSDPGPQPRTSVQIVREMRELLAGAEISGPYVLVGHSFGGLDVRLFASLYPDDVAGVILVDTPHEDWFSRLSPAVRRGQDANLRLLNIGRFIAPLGLTRLLRKPVVVPRMPQSSKAMASAIGYRARNYAATYFEFAAVEESMGQVRAASVTFPGHIPLIVLTHGLSHDLLPAGLDPDELERAEHLWSEQQEALAALSANSELVVAEKSGHMIQLEEPGLVIAAIRKAAELAEVTRGGAPSSLVPGSPSMVDQAN